ncbi:MAG: TonB-dependent receptor plug domain-containing protein, partial [Acidobacteria bacterium]|nr:TonB-dependent receptor plug domain-containing protein [Acidobacteriota bacterium]
MRHQHRARAVRGFARTMPAVITLPTLLALVLAAPAAAGAQQNAAAQPAAEQAAAQSGAAENGDEPLTFLDSVTVTATLAPAPVMETPGTVTVIDSQTIQERMITDFADLVKYEPGVYVENSVTRLGLNGFNIRGIGGNRVMTQVDGFQMSEQFDFGPFNVHQFGIDVDALQSVEIVRSANSALYGSDALGGVVSLFTKDPEDWLRGNRFHVGAKTVWDGRANDAIGKVAVAGGGDRIQASLFVSGNRGSEIRNQGTIETTDDSRTAPNPQNVRGSQVLAKLVFTPTPGNMWRAAAEMYDT